MLEVKVADGEDREDQNEDGDQPVGEAPQHDGQQDREGGEVDQRESNHDAEAEKEMAHAASFSHFAPQNGQWLIVML